MNIMMRSATRFVVRLTVAIVLLGLAFAPAFVPQAQAGNTNRTGTAGAQELLIPVGGRGVALGSSNIAFSTGVDAIYWNPAGVARSTFGTEAYFSHMSYFAGIGVDYGALSVGFSGVGTFAASFKSISFGNIDVTTEANPDGTGVTYSPTYIVAGLTYSRQLTDRISVGANFNYISETIVNTSAGGFAFDAGVQYNGLLVPELKLGVVLKNLGPNMTYSGPNLLRQGTTVGDIRGTQWYSVNAASFELPSQLEIGLAYDRKINDMNDVTIFGAFQNNNYSSDLYNVGLEYGFDNILFVRGGYNFAPQAPKDQLGQSENIYDFTLGAGINYNLGAFNFTFDYAYQHAVILTSNNVFTVKLGF